MADYLIQDTTLDAIADAINAKTGGSSAMTPAEMVTAIGSISGGGEDTLGLSLAGNFTGEYVNDDITTIEQYSFYYNNTAPQNCRFPNATMIYRGAFEYSQTLVSIFAPKSVLNGTTVFRGAYLLQTAVLGAPNGNSDVFRRYTTMALSLVDFAKADAAANQVSFGNQFFQGCSNLQTLILRAPRIYSPSYLAVFQYSSMDQDGAGCTIYIPKALYDELGTGSALDYKNSSNWATVDSYGTITWAQIEGSYYETHYGDGTPIPTT